MKKTKIFGLIAMGLVGLGGLASIPLGITSCNKKGGGGGNVDPIPEPPVYIPPITQSTIDENGGKYKVESGSDI
jgi:hypothetical protein